MSSIVLGVLYPIRLNGGASPGTSVPVILTVTNDKISALNQRLLFLVSTQPLSAHKALFPHVQRFSGPQHGFKATPLPLQCNEMKHSDSQLLQGECCVASMYKLNQL